MSGDFWFESQLTTIHNRKQVGLIRIRKLELALFMDKVKNKKLEGELSISQAELDVKRYTRIKVEELSDA